MKKNKMMRIASVLLVAVLLSTCAISGTFAKYVSTSSGTDTARVAKWDVKISGSTMTNTMSFNLFDTVKDETGDDADDDVKSANSDKVIAPGTRGQFNFSIQNASEVTAEYTVDYTVTNTNNIPVKFSLDGNNWKDSIDELDVSDAKTLAINATADPITVYWMWDFATDSAIDNPLGAAGSAVLKVDVKVVATQVN